MPSTFFGLNIAKSGMATYNAWLNTTGHNISNVKTPGYTRQKVIQAATIPISYKTSYGMVGSGSEAVRIESQRDVYYDNKYHMSNSDYAMYDTQTYYMQSIESYVYAKDSTSGGMTNALNDFFNSITSLTRSVTDTTIRTQVMGFADSLTKSIQEAAYSLQSLQEDVNNQIVATVNQINAYAQEIAFITKQINVLEVDGTRANDLRDKRAYIIDQLSELANVEVEEKEPVGNKGFAQYIVSVGGVRMVDTYDYYTIECEAQDTFFKQNDVTDLYSLRLSNGQDFDIRSSLLGGRLQALFELRDGNNGEVLSGTATGAAGSRVLTISNVNEIGSSIFKLDIPATDGIITVGSSKYTYKSFEAVWNTTTQSYDYTFQLDPNGPALGTIAADTPARVGDPVDFRGIPYYMSQLNEFIRTFSNKFNKIQMEGYDLNGEQGKQMFGGTDSAMGYAMDFVPYPLSISDPHPNFSSGLPTDTNGNIVTTNGYVTTSYYRLTALNTNIDKRIANDGRLLACADALNGVENGGNLAHMSALENDKTMFKEGQPGSFLQILTSTLGVDSQQAKTAAENAKNIRDFVDIRRLSEAGVDEDEEGQNLIICQNLLNYQYKVLSVMNEVLDKLINGTAV